MINIFVGNLSYSTTSDDLQAAFEPFGQVDRVNVIKDRDSGQSRGFAFVEMSNRDEATAAIESLNGRQLNGRAMNVNEARPRDERGGGGGGNRGGYGGNRGGGGGYGGGGGGNRRREPRW